MFLDLVDFNHSGFVDGGHAPRPTKLMDWMRGIFGRF